MSELDPDHLRIVYMGTPDFAVPALEALIDSRHEVVGVFTQPDRQSGRGKKLRPPAVKKVAVDHAIPVYQPESVDTEEAIARLREWQPDVAVVAAYGQILPEPLLDVPRLGCVNIHASLLPKYRGAAPINWAIVEGEEETGVTIMKMDAGLDTGPILTKHVVELGPLTSAEQLHDELAEVGAAIIVEALESYAAGDIDPTPQDEAGGEDEASYASMLSKSDGRIDWTQSASGVANHIRGFNPWPGAFSYHGSEEQEHRIKFHLARPAEGEGSTGEVLRADATEGVLEIACGEGAIEVLEIQAPGKRAMAAGDFLNGYDIERGDAFV